MGRVSCRKATHTALLKLIKLLFLLILVFFQQPLKLFLITGSLQPLSSAFAALGEGFCFFLSGVDDPSCNADHGKDEEHDQDRDQYTGDGEASVGAL